MWIDEIAEYAEAKNIADLPLPIFVQQMGPDVRKGAMLIGPQTGVMIDAELPGLHKTNLQLVVRAAKSGDSETLAQAISDAIETEQEVTLTKLRIRHIRPRHLPVSFPRSAGDYFEAVVNFDLCFDRISA